MVPEISQQSRVQKSTPPPIPGWISGMGAGGCQLGLHGWALGDKAPFREFPAGEEGVTHREPEHIPSQSGHRDLGEDPKTILSL